MSKDSTKDNIDKLIRTHKVAVFSKQRCPYCLGARNTIRKHVGKELSQTDIVFYDIEKARDIRVTQNYLRLITGARIVPNIFIHGQFIGGLGILKTLHDTGELARILKAGPETKLSS